MSFTQKNVMMISFFVVVLGVIADISSVDAQPDYPPDISSVYADYPTKPDYKPRSPPPGSSVANDDVYNNGDDDSIIGTPTPISIASKIIVMLVGAYLGMRLRQKYCKPPADSKEDEKDVEAPPPPTTTGNNNNMPH